MMSDALAALRAAKEVQADTLAPELYRQANEWYLQAQREYKFKNFYLAKIYIQKARGVAERAEIEALLNCGDRMTQAVANEFPQSQEEPVYEKDPLRRRPEKSKHSADYP